jgi:hypothetical protein
MQSLGSTSARIRAATASWPPDEPAPPARAGGAGRIARLQVPDHRALSVHVALRRQPAARYGSRLRRRDHKAAAYPHAESVLQLRTWSAGRALLPSAHSSCRASTASHTAQRSPRLLRQPGERVSRRSRSSCARKRVGMSARRACTGPQLLGRARPAAQPMGFRVAKLGSRAQPGLVAPLTHARPQRCAAAAAAVLATE